MLPKLYDYKELRLWERETISIYPLCLQNIRRWKIWSRVSKKKSSSNQDLLRSLITHTSETAVKILNLLSFPTQSVVLAAALVSYFWC